jgi:hypothetical protein
MYTLVLTEYSNKVLTYSLGIEGSVVLSNQLAILIEDYGQLFERRLDLLNGIAFHKKHVMCRILDSYGLGTSGEFLHFRSFFTLVPCPGSDARFISASDNVLYLVRLLKRNCYYMKTRLNTMRTIIDEFQNKELELPDMLHNMYLNCENLYFGMQGEIGFLANIVYVDSLSIV